MEKEGIEVDGKNWGGGDDKEGIKTETKNSPRTRRILAGNGKKPGQLHFFNRTPVWSAYWNFGGRFVQGASGGHKKESRDTVSIRVNGKIKV